jgi:hypothetical protein
VHVHLSARHVQIAADDERRARCRQARGKRIELFQKAHLSRKVLPAVRHIDRRHGHLGQSRHDDAVLVVEGRVLEHRSIGRGRLADVQPDPGVRLSSVPVAPVALDVAQPDRELVERRFDLLQAEHVRLLMLDERQQLGLTRADAVDVPGDDVHAELSFGFGPRQSEILAHRQMIENEVGTPEGFEEPRLIQRLCGVAALA